VRIIREQVAAVVGEQAHVRVFGSRVDDTASGGNVDLLVDVPTAVTRPAVTAARLSARIGRALDGRQVDVGLAAPTLAEQPIHRLARAHGVPL
jgi:predicted nucleotidyltransferase